MLVDMFVRFDEDKILLFFCSLNFDLCVFIEFICLLVCLSDLMNMKFIFCFCSLNFELGVFRFCSFSWNKKVTKLKCFILYESVNIADNVINKFQISIDS